MKHIYLNLKRFDIPTEAGGVNRIASPAEWGPYIVSHTQDQLAAYNPKDVEFAMFFPEAHLIGAVSARKAGAENVASDGRGSERAGREGS